MRKRSFFIILVLLVTSFLVFANSSESAPAGLVKISKKQSENNNIYINNGEFYRFDFNKFKDRFAYVEVLNKSGNRISLYSVGYKKKVYSDVFYISQNAAKVNIYFSKTEDVLERLETSIKITKNTNPEDTPYSIYDGVVFAGQNNYFNFSGFNKAYAIVQCLDDTGREINFIAEKRQENGRAQEFFIPAKTRKIRFATSNSETSFYTPCEVVNVTPSKNPLTIKSFMASTFRNLDLSIYQRKTKENFGVIQYLDSKYNVIYADTIKNSGENVINGKVYVPRDALFANIAFSDSEIDFSQAFDFIDILPTTASSALKSPDSFYEAEMFKTTEINPILNEFITYLNINLFKTQKKIDLLLDFITEKIDQLTTDDYEKVKLYHDATVALLTYNEFSEAKNYKDAISKGAVNSLGFALVFKEFCSRGNIPCLVIHGNAKKFDHGATGWNPKNGIVENQYWNIVVINNNSYLCDISLDSKETKGSAFYTNGWLFVRPEEFIYSHYPLNAEFQLLKEVVTPERYLKMQFTKTGIITEEEVRKLEEQKAAKLEAEKAAREQQEKIQAVLDAAEQEEEELATGKKKQKKEKAKKEKKSKKSKNSEETESEISE